MAEVNTTLGPIDESELQKLENVIDNENEHTTTIEYCLANCPGEAHKTGKPDSVSHFCGLHVHRSAHITLKQPVTLEGVAGGFV